MHGKANKPSEEGATSWDGLGSLRLSMRLCDCVSAFARVCACVLFVLPVYECVKRRGGCPVEIIFFEKPPGCGRFIFPPPDPFARTPFTTQFVGADSATEECDFFMSMSVCVSRSRSFSGRQCPGAGATVSLCGEEGLPTPKGVPMFLRNTGGVGNFCDPHNIAQF